MVQKASQYRDELADREAIRACIHQYCRAQDMQDEVLLHDIYWPGAIDDHVHFCGPKEGSSPGACRGCARSITSST
jgi:hypothetical protein